MSFETARGVVHAWQCDHMGHAFFHLGLTPTVLRGEIRMAVRSRLAEISKRNLRMEHEVVNVCIDSSTRKPRSLPQGVKDRAAQLLDGKTP